MLSVNDSNFMNRFFLIEGPDNVGKSTLVRNLRDYYTSCTFTVLQNSNISLTGKESIDYFTKVYTEMFSTFKYFGEHFENSGIICDRSHVGEMVYSPLYRNYSGKYVLDIEKSFEDILDQLVLVLLIDEPENLIKRDDGKSFSTVLEQKRKEIKLFEEAFDNSLIQDKIQIDISCLNEQEVLKYII